MASTPWRVAMIGTGFMGTVHSHAWRSVAHVFPVRAVERSVVCGRDPERTEEAATRLGWTRAETDWRRVIEDETIDIVDICAPGDAHMDIAIAALDAGKHVICEKPLANTVAEAELMVRAADAAASRGIAAMVAFNYRRVPAVAYARALVAEGRLGEIRHVRGLYLQDWIADASFPLVWRLQKERAGSGSLGDIGAHVIDAAEYVTGQRFDEVSATLHTFVTQRPLASTSVGLSAVGGDDKGEVTVDDAALVTGRMTGGALATIEATRFATGRKNAMRLEVNGSLGSIAFDFESMNELNFYDANDPGRDAGFRRVYVTEPDHPYAAAWWPPGHGLGYDHAFVNELGDFLTDLAEGRQPQPSFEDGLHLQRVLDASERSSDNGSAWTPVENGKKRNGSRPR